VLEGGGIGGNAVQLRHQEQACQARVRRCSHSVPVPVNESKLI
jgi:hypothetical protein